jgi:hypothetical protein
MSTANKIRSTIIDLPKGSVFSCTDFLSVGTRASNDQALYRMVHARQIIRFARGLYTVAGEVDTNAVALAIEKKLANALAKRYSIHPLPPR